ncbi:phospholipase D family protein [Planctomycetota bacterium]
MLQFVTDRAIYTTLICERIPRARQVLWLATADLKDLYVDKQRKMVPFLEVLADLVRKQVEIRLLHAKRPGPIFWKDYNRYPVLDEGMEMMLCPRVHLKCAIIDHKIAYSGSANFTGAGVGAKGEHKRNFEAGIVTDEPNLVSQIADQFDTIWRGDFCGKCRRKVYCSAHEDVLGEPPSRKR